MKKPLLGIEILLLILIACTNVKSQTDSIAKSNKTPASFVNGFSQIIPNKKIFISYFNTKDSSIKSANRKVHFEGKFAYFNENKSKYFLSYSEPPKMNFDVCNRLNKINQDSIITFQMPYVMQSIIIFFVDSNGTIINHGIAWGNPNEYYKNQTLSLLDSLSAKVNFIPAQINGTAVKSVFRIFLNYYSKECKLNWTPDFSKK